VSITLQESRDEVHGYVGTWFGVDDGRDMKERCLEAVSQVFVLLTGGAAFDIFCDPRSCAGPEVFFVYASDHFVSSGVTIKGSIMPGVHNLAFQPLIGGDDEAVFGDISPEWCVWAVYVFNGECVFPLFHETAVIVLDNRDKVFH
jgi:hypothetical protein